MPDTKSWSASVKIGGGGGKLWGAPAAPVGPDAASLLRSAHQLWREGRTQEAFEAARRSAQADPTNAEALGIVGGLAFELKYLLKAEEALRACAALLAEGEESWAHVVSLLASTLAIKGASAEAERLASQVERWGTSQPAVSVRLGELFLRLNLAERSVPHFERAVAAQPNRADFQMHLGNAYRFCGRVDEAEAQYETTIEIQPKSTEAHRVLAEMKRARPEANHIDRMLALAAQPESDPLDRARVAFGLAKEYDDLRQEDEAWRWLVTANTAAGEANGPWSGEIERRWVQDTKKAFADSVQAGPAPDGAGPTPVFIVGLPRSGTTLVERVIAAHSDVVAMGELETMSQTLKRAIRKPYEAGLLVSPEDLAHADWAEVARTYRAETAVLWGGGSYVVDKMPYNSLYVGAIRRAFPEAVIVDVRRSAMDCLFGAYKRLFYGVYEWSYDQADLAGHYLLHRDLMEHWRGTLGGPGYVEIVYEDLIADPELHIRRLLAEAGLPFQNACLRPHETKGAVSTASATQVRRPINKDGLGSWRRYADRLEPMRRLLAEHDAA